MINKLYERKATLEAALHTVSYQIDNLQAHFSKPQIREWKRHRRNLKQKLKFITALIKRLEHRPPKSAATSHDYLKSLIQKSQKNEIRKM